MAEQVRSDLSRLVPYVPRLLQAWSPTGADPRHMRVHGSLAFCDISGFTRLTERLARKGKVGAEELSDILDATFAGLLDEATAEGADLVKWGGDAVLLLFRGDGHAARAARATYRMRDTLRRAGRVETSSGAVVLRMSSGVHSGDLDFFLVGDPAIHRELLVSGPGASTTAELEAVADAGQVGLSAATAALLPQRLLGPPVPGGRLLRRIPEPRASAEHADEELGDRLAITPRQARPLQPLPLQRSGVAPVDALPPPIRAHLLDDVDEPAHRTVTVAFVQFSGADRLLAEEGPGALAEGLDEVVRAVQHACAQHEVTFFESDIGRDGGKIMLTAGVPRSTGHHEERMLRVARQVADRAGRLPLRIGVNRGHVFAGGFGPPYRRTWSIKGDAVNLAARLLGRAGPGEVVATQEVVAHSRTEFHTEHLAPFTVKGRTRPVHAVVLGQQDDPRGDDGLGVDLVGRSDELALLAGALEEARTGRGRAVRVVGPPGIGKTRLVTELGRTSGVRVLSTRCEAYESATAFFPTRRLLREALGLPRDPSSAAEQLHLRVAALAPSLAPWTPLLGLPLDLALPPTPETADLESQFVGARLEEVVVDLLTAALPEPTIFLVEDTDHIDDASAQLVDRLARAAADRPWLVLTTSEHAADDPAADDDSGGPPEADGPAEDRRTTLHLGPLDDAESLTLTRRVLAEHPLTPHDMALLARRSGGNPMFLEALTREARRFRDVAELPDTVDALVTTDIDRLAPADRRALQYAAVLGSVVDEEALDRLLAADGGLQADVLRRLDAFLVRGESGRLRFHSTLVRDVAYEALPYRLRRQLHEGVGRVIEAASPDPEARCEVLSLHFFHARDEARAWHYSVLAGRRAVGKDAHGEAIEFFERAVQSAPRDGSLAPGELAAVLEQLADSRFLLGLTDDATDAYGAARRELRDDPVSQAFLIEKEVRVDLRRRRFALAMRRLTRGLHALDGHVGPRADTARSLLARRYAYSRFAQGRIDDALRWAERAATHAEESLDKGALAQAWEMLNAIHAGSGRPEPFPYGRLALEANRELGDLAPQAHCLNNLAVEAFTHGRWAEALSEYREATDIFRRTGDTAAEANAAYNQAGLLMRQGRHDEAAPLLADVLLISRAVEDEELVALVQREQAQALAAQVGSDAGLTLLAEARDRFTELGEADEVAVTDAVRAELLLAAGRHADAGRVLEDMLNSTRPDCLDGVAARWHRLSAGVRLAEGRLADARDELLAGLEAAVADEDRFEQALALRDLVDLARASGEPDDPDVAARSREIFAALGVVSAR